MYAALKRDGHRLRESAIVCCTKSRWSRDAKVRWYAALKCNGHMVHAKMRLYPVCGAQVRWSCDAKVRSEKFVWWFTLNRDGYKWQEITMGFLAFLPNSV